jgi:hypothetical protein
MTLGVPDMPLWIECGEAGCMMKQNFSPLDGRRG